MLIVGSEWENRHFVPCVCVCLCLCVRACVRGGGARRANRADLSSDGDLMMTPLQADIEIPIPRFFLSERAKELEERRKMLSDITSTMEVPENLRVREGLGGGGATQECRRFIFL